MMLVFSSAFSISAFAVPEELERNHDIISEKILLVCEANYRDTVAKIMNKNYIGETSTHYLFKGHRGSIFLVKVQNCTKIIKTDVMDYEEYFK